MNFIPATILDNFLDNPEAIVKWASTLEYSETSRAYPGKRSKPIEELNPEFNKYLFNKIFTLFSPVGDFGLPKENYRSRAYFQLIDNVKLDGWPHQDPGQITFLIYLSKEDKTNRGTSLYKLSSDVYFPLTGEKNSFSILNEVRGDHHVYGDLKDNNLKLKKDYHQNFEKILDIKDRFNRLFCFSSSLCHSANNFSSETPRLTIVGNIDNISTPYLLPIERSKQTLYFS